MKTKKILAGALAAAVVATSLPGMGVPVFAAGSFLTPNSNCYTTDNPFAFPMGAGEVKTLEAELATTLYNDTSNNENNRWPMKIQTENGVTAVYDMAKNGDYATYAYTAEAGLYLVTAHYACGGNNTMVVSDAVTKSDKVNTVFVQVASTSVNNIPQWRTTQFLLRINKTGAGTLKIASTSGNQAEDAPRLDKLEITKMQMPKYEGENRFSFPTELNAATPATLEAEYGIITNVITTEDENGNYPAQEKMDNDRGKDPWTGNRYFLTSVNTGDSVAYAYHAEKPGIYEFTARYRSGSNDNHYTWSSTDSKIVAGSVQAGHTDSSATQTKTFKVAVAEAGDGILTFAAPNPSSSGKKNMAMTDKFDITLVVDKSALVSAIENVKDLNLADYEDAGKEAFTTALTTAKTVNTNYTDALTQEKVNDAVDALNTAKNALTLKASSKSFTDIKRMFAKEPMTAEQFGIYLGECKAAGDFISDKTIKRYIEKLCKMSDGKITPSKFMKTVDGTDVYIIQPEIQELLVAMFDTDFFGAKGKPKAGIDVKQRLRAQLAENVEIYLDEDIKKQVKSAPQFLNARLEDILTEKINNEVRGMFATMQDSDDTIQYQLMLETLDRLVAIRRWMNEWNARINLIKQEFAKTEQEKQDAKNKTGLFKHKQLQDILIDVISNLLEGKEYEYISEEEEIFYPTLYAASKMYDITAMPGNELTLWLQEVEENISNLKRYKYIRRKARALFDENDHLEKKILDSIDKIARTQLVSNESDMTPEQYERLVRFTEDASMEEKQEILCKLEQSGNLTLDEQTLKEIMDIKDAVEKKQEYGML